ncbi:hypothetical protein VKT23_009805 [Stygiomarasmius scandens]|uniref:Uncharacterized protein n=1 Tax=Marasmiellus scandens TaxID=2682957 RepID=A0ABR1JED3_9AGAR
MYPLPAFIPNFFSSAPNYFVITILIVACAACLYGMWRNGARLWEAFRASFHLTKKGKLELFTESEAPSRPATPVRRPDNSNSSTPSDSPLPLEVGVKDSANLRFMREHDEPRQCSTSGNDKYLLIKSSPSKTGTASSFDRPTGKAGNSVENTVVASSGEEKNRHSTAERQDFDEEIITFEGTKLILKEVEG